jgi:hypothetical protein
MFRRIQFTRGRWPVRDGIAVLLTVLLLGCTTAAQVGTGKVTLSVPVNPPELALDNFGIVQQGILYRGAQPTVDTKLGLNGFEVLASKYKVRTVIDLMNEPIDRWILRRKRDCAMMTRTEREALRYVGLPSYEASPRRSTLIRILRIVQRPENRPVFLHCSAGQNRTGAMIAGFRVVEELWDPADAKAEMTRFHVLRAWEGINDRFIDEMARARESVRQEVRETSGEEPAVVTCGP